MKQRPFLGEAHRLAATLAARWQFGRDDHSPHQVLCFDGGDGIAAAAICQRMPGLCATVVVAQEAVKKTEILLEACGLGNRCLVYAGTPLKLPVCAHYDHVVLFHALYPMRKSTAAALKAVSERLVAGGELCSVHWFCLEAARKASSILDKAPPNDSRPLCHVEQFGEHLREAGLIEDGCENLVGDCGNVKLHFSRRTQGSVCTP